MRRSQAAVSSLPHRFYHLRLASAPDSHEQRVHRIAPAVPGEAQAETGNGSPVALGANPSRLVADLTGGALAVIG
ncbi:MAG: hypothetical protein ACI9U2_004280 [Bradymonadia bacterium]|jgi:hypothetical protein